MENVYCGKCGAELGLTIAQTIAKRGISDRKAIEYELTEAVADRLKKWFGLALALVHPFARPNLISICFASSPRMRFSSVQILF